MSVRKEVFYGNAKALLGKPAKRVWFRLNPLLEKTSLFVSRQQDNSQFTLPLQSVVISEKCLSDESAFQSTCTEADFWDYLWSENWKGLSSVRVFEGQLFDTLLEAFYALEESKTVASYQTGVFTENHRFTKKTLKGSPNLTEIKETLNIRFTYFGRRTPSARVPSSACSSETMSVPEFEDTPLSDEEYRPYEQEHEQLPEEQHYQEIPLTETKPDTLVLRKGKGKEKQKTAAAIEEYFSDMSSSQSQPMTRLSLYTPYHELSKPPSARSSPADKSPYQHTMYSLPHFRCSRPTRLNNEDASLMEKRDQDPEPEESKSENNGLWLTDIMDSLSLSGERTVQRLRKRLEELKAERKKNIRKPTKKVGNYLLELVKLVDSYGKKKMAIPRLLRCEKVPTFRQYIVTIIEDKTYDPRFRNKRRVEKFSKRFNLQSLSDMSIGEQDNERSAKDTTKKTGKNKRNKGHVVKPKPRKEPSKTNVVSEQSTHTQSADGTPVPVTGDGGSLDFVNIVVGITDCTAFRNPLIEITEEDEQERLKGDADLHLRLGDNSTGSRHKIKTAPQSSNKFSMSTVTTDTEGLEGGLAGSYRSQTQRSHTDSMVIARGESILSKYGPKQRKRKTTLSNRVDEEDEFDFDNGIFSPQSGSTATPDLFDLKKLNRKYSFEKLKESNDKKKPKFKDILKRFVKISKVAAVFRKSAMAKSKRRTFVNPLQMSPSPDPSMQFVGKVTYRREAIRPDMELPDFKHLRVAEFREKLLKALDQFVVRKEQIMSSYKNRSLTSITFTRPEVFSIYED